jgi:hypothetical protein
VSIQPIVTVVINNNAPGIAEQAPSLAVQFFQVTGIQVMTVDGQISPVAVIFLMFAAWGVWHWMIMAFNGAKNIKRFIDERNL